MLHRSAVFLVVFLVVHMLGNLSFLASDDAFNQYQYPVIYDSMLFWDGFILSNRAAENSRQAPLQSQQKAHTPECHGKKVIFFLCRV